MEGLTLGSGQEFKEGLAGRLFQQNAIPGTDCALLAVWGSQRARMRIDGRARVAAFMLVADERLEG